MINNLYLSHILCTINKNRSENMIENTTGNAKPMKSINPIKIASDKEIHKISKKIIVKNKELYINLAK